MHQELSSECDNFTNLQSLNAHVLQVGVRIGMFFNYYDSDEDQHIKMWRKGEIKAISNSKLTKRER